MSEMPIMFASAIQKVAGGGYIILQGDKIVAARSTLPECHAWHTHAMEETFGEATYLPPPPRYEVPVQQFAPPPREFHNPPPPLPTHYQEDAMPRFTRPNGIAEGPLERMRSSLNDMDLANRIPTVGAAMIAVMVAMHTAWPFGA